jgi:hypothetical protein
LPVADTSGGFSDILFTPNPFLEAKAASSNFIDVGFGFSISAFDNDDTPLILNDGESVVLFSIPMHVSAAGIVLEENLQLFNLMSITRTGLDPESAPVLRIGPAIAQAIPEPSSAGLLAMMGGVAGVLRRRRA